MSTAAFKEGIHNAVQVCMKVTGEDRVLIISDQATLEIGQALAAEAEGLGAAVKLVQLEDYGPRPLTEVPAALVEDLSAMIPTVTFYAASGQAGEVKMRLALNRRIRLLFDEMEQPRPRHGHMISITPRLIEEGMTADYIEINRLTYQVLEIVEKAREIKVTSSRGTEITVEIDPDLKWVPCHGLYHQPGDWGNLPEGEVFTCPGNLDGVLVVDVLGDYFSPKYGVLEHPLTIEVEDGFVRKVDCQNGALAEEFQAYLNSVENGTRAGEFAIGTNTAVTELTGNLLQDEKIPGIHVAFGNPSGHETGADWTSEVHVDVVPVECTIVVDGVTLMEKGKFVLPE